MKPIKVVIKDWSTSKADREAYAKYYVWCESLNIVPAPFDVWRRTTQTISSQPTYKPGAFQ